MTEPEPYPYGYCEAPDCHSRPAVIRNKARWKWDGLPLCTACLKRRQRRSDLSSQPTTTTNTNGAVQAAANPRRVRRA